MSDRQQLLEAQRQKGIKAIILDTLEQCRGQKYAIQRASLELGVSDATLYNWCKELEIDINDYR